MSGAKSDSRAHEAGERGARRHVACGALLVVALVVASFAPAFEGRLLDWDDHATLVHNPRVRGLSAENVEWMFRTSYLGPYQPLSWLSLGLDYELFGLDAGFDPPQAERYHVTNVVLHALAALACLFAALRALALAAPNASAVARAWSATLAAALFAVHPLRVESVAWVTERRDVLSGLFFMLALAAWLHASSPGADAIVARGRALLGVVLACAVPLLFAASVDLGSTGELAWRGPGAVGVAAAFAALAASTALIATSLRSRTASWKRWTYAAAVLALLLACGAKGLSLVFPAVVYVLDVWPLRRVARGSRLAALVEKAPLVAVAIPFALLAMWGQRSMGTDTLLDWSAHTPLERVTQALHSLAHYSWRTLAPLGLLPIYDLPDELSLTDARFLVPALGVLAFTALAIALRRRAPALLATWVAFALAIAPVSGLTQAGPQLAADRYSYLSCWPFAWLAAGAWLVWFEHGRSRALALAVAHVVVAASCVATWRYTRVWRDSESLWTYTLARAPDSPIATAQLAGCRARAAAELSAPEKRNELLAESERLFARAIALDATPNVMHLRDWGGVLVQLGRHADAVEPLTRYLERRGLDPEARTNLGAALRQLGRTSEALAQLEYAVKLSPDSGAAWAHLGFAREAAGDKSGAIAAFERVAELWPRHAPTREKLAKLKGGG